MQILKPFIAACLALSLVATSGNACARFVSVDPVQPETNSGENFNRYHYAGNNPYRFVDPDGRQSRELNFEAKLNGYEPPPRSADDWLGPAIGAALTGMVTAPVLGVGAGAIMSRPAAASVFNAAADVGMGDALGGASLAPGGATLFRVVDSKELKSIFNSEGMFFPSPNGSMVKQFVDNVGDATALAQKFTQGFGGPQTIVRAYAPQSVLNASDVTEFHDFVRGADAISIPNAQLPNVGCLGFVDAC